MASERPAGAFQPASIRYRADIDGLRGIAVLMVVWFHSGLPGMPGGFGGVDVFFVISGYLITSIIQRDAGEGRFSFGYFYQRRFRRIAPALVTVTASTTVAAYALLLPYELDQFAQSAVATVAMVSNVFFWRTANYFAFAHGVVPLLHSWSLGVEEQFYLLMPAVLVIAARLGKPRLVVGLLGIASFLLCLIMTKRAPAGAFYLLPTRGWELMIGAALAQNLPSIPEHLKRARYAKHAEGLAGLALVLMSGVLLSAADPFPGWRALVPTLGAALLIGGGPSSITGRSLSFGPLVYVGRLSYSLYLWHWPIFVLLRHWRADVELPPAWDIGGIALAVLLSVVSFRWIEQPARERSTRFRLVLVPCLVGAAAILLASAIAIAGKGLPQRLPPAVVKIAFAHDAYAPLAHRCTTVSFGYALEHCRIGPAGEPQLLLWGDSHAAAVSEAVAQGTRMPGLVISTGACPPVPDWPGGEVPGACRTNNARALQLAERDRHMTTVVLSAYWLALETGPPTQFWQSEQQMIDRLNAAGKTVVVVAGVPDPGSDVPWSSAIRQRFGRPPLNLTCPKAHIPLHGIILVDVSAAFCGQPAYMLFSDSNHPSRYAGLAIIAPAIRKAMQAGP
ncbi:acyltransferase family protein [Sphingomonas sp.]|uniref:acyltransferase family protein n=1 Tax=Sphingomonas sp. TaxID=28214 RepID=UPI0038B37BFB